MGRGKGKPDWKLRQEVADVAEAVKGETAATVDSGGPAFWSQCGKCGNYIGPFKMMVEIEMAPKVCKECLDGTREKQEA